MAIEDPPKKQEPEEQYVKPDPRPALTGPDGEQIHVLAPTKATGGAQG